MGAQRLAFVTLFPDIFQSFIQASLLGQAVRDGLVSFHFENPRDYGLGRHKSVDDTPYGGGSGMVLRVDVLVATLEALEARLGERPRRILLTPGGAPFRQADARRLSLESSITFICGRYEGFDARIEAHVDEELSLGDFVLCGGEVAAMAISEAVVRLRPGVLGNELSVVEESYGGPLLEYAQYTRPTEFRGAAVPSVLAGGHHGRILAWRKTDSEERTRARRPDLYAPYAQAKAAADAAIAAEKSAKRARRKRPPTSAGDIRVDCTEDAQTHAPTATFHPDEES